MHDLKTKMSSFKSLVVNALGIAGAIIAFSLTALQLYDYYDTGSRSFEGEASVSGYSSSEFIEMLNQNVGETVSLKLLLDASASTAVNTVFMESNLSEDEADQFRTGKFDGMELPMLDDDACSTEVRRLIQMEDGAEDTTIDTAMEYGISECKARYSVRFNFGGTTPEPSYGGTGIVQFNLFGDYRVSSAAKSGLRFLYILSEQ